ncbi:hypothetical protein [Paracoccus tegillarcae]|uniref:Sulfotransferase family protein n=1 Tax=Paracoccus tegillarcae TaxID=1529068 RepID=A0A2K9EIZ5_9RHOB|nr:hypothetical protein [Paracoccus tegillarcae]AUH34960.1 hypothetical protein CUV01_17665 [Paracoccus tegillarcae]
MADAQTGDSGPRRLIVHLGVQKTGTTSLHHSLARNAEQLADRLIIRTPEAGTPMRPLGRAAIAFSLDPGSDNEARLAEALATVLDGLPQDGRTVLISHENLAGAMPGNGGETRLFPLLPRILGVLDRVAAPMRPVYAIYRRPMAAWKASVWAQAVRTDGYGRTYQEFLDETRDLPGWDDLTDRLQQAVPGRWQVFDLADEPDASRPGQQLLRLAGLDDSVIAGLRPLAQPSMQRLNTGATEFLRRLNNLALNPQARSKVADLVTRAQPLFNADHRPEGTL